jgi:hypothetical protein
VFPSLRTCASDVQLTEGAITQDLAVGPQRLLQDFAAMSDEQQPRPSTLDTKSAVVQGGDHGLPRACGRDDEVAVAIVNTTLYVDRVQHLLLIRKRSDLDT